jgi:hypothetical protein
VRTPGSDASAVGGGRGVAWLAGVLLGVLLGLLSLLASPFVLILIIPFVLAALRRTAPRVGLAGGLMGIGTTWLALVLAASSRCSTVMTANSYSTCTPPDVTGWVAAAAVAFVVGLVQTVVISSKGSLRA